MNNKYQNCEVFVFTIFTSHTLAYSRHASCVSIFSSQATLAPILSSVVYTFRLKMLLSVLIKNCNLCVYWRIILSNKLDLDQEPHFTIISFSLLTI
jgi:hypothetical protein